MYVICMYNIYAYTHKIAGNTGKWEEWLPLGGVG